jgi:hypothetical protein
MINDLPKESPRPDRPAAPAAARRADYGHQQLPALCTHAVTYRLTCDEYEAMRDRAEDRCEICRRRDRDTPRGELVIDHFQGRGVWFVRGLLCDRCNALMQRHDGTAPWGPATRALAAEARAYHLRAFGEPSAEELERADELIQGRCTALRARLEPAPDEAAPDLEAIARDLRTSLTPAQVARLAELLASPWC